MIIIKRGRYDIRSYRVINPFKSACYYVPTGGFNELRAFRSLKSAAKFMAKVCTNIMYQELEGDWFYVNAELHRGQYWEYYSEHVKVDKW